MAHIYYVKENEIQRIQTYPTWEDAYLYLTEYAKNNGYQMRVNGAVKQETNQ